MSLHMTLAPRRQRTVPARKGSVRVGCLSPCTACSGPPGFTRRVTLAPRPHLPDSGRADAELSSPFFLHFLSPQVHVCSQGALHTPDSPTNPASSHTSFGLPLAPGGCTQALSPNGTHLVAHTACCHCGSSQVLPDALTTSHPPCGHPLSSKFPLPPLLRLSRCCFTETTDFYYVDCGLGSTQQCWWGGSFQGNHKVLGTKFEPAAKKPVLSPLSHLSGLLYINPGFDPTWQCSGFPPGSVPRNHS